MIPPVFSMDTAQISGLPEDARAQLTDLLKIYAQHYAKNAVKAKYYAGDIPLSEVNLGIALPQGMAGLEIGCAWGAKTVDVLAGRSLFDGYVGAEGQDVPELQALVTKNRLVAEYQRHCRDELTFGCTFSTLSRDPVLGCRIRFHTPRSAAARWNGEKGRIDCGFAVLATEEPAVTGEPRPTVIALYTDSDTWVLRRKNMLWSAQRVPHKLGRPLMEPLIWNATSEKPFGQSRIGNPVRRLIQGYVRTVANATIGLEFSTTPQKYLLGVTDEQFDAVVNDKFRQYVGSILTTTPNPDTGQNPSFGQLLQGNIQPHIEMMRLLSTQFSAATGLSVSDTGVVNDANPTSSEALEAQTATLIGLAEQLNTGNGDPLRAIALMALAIANETTVDQLSDEQKAVVAHFKSPNMPSVAASADAATKISSARPGFAQTDVFLEMMGFDPADIRRIKAQEQRNRGLDFFGSLTEEEA